MIHYHAQILLSASLFDYDHYLFPKQNIKSLVKDNYHTDYYSKSAIS